MLYATDKWDDQLGNGMSNWAMAEATEKLYGIWEMVKDDVHFSYNKEHFIRAIGQSKVFLHDHLFSCNDSLWIQHLQVQFLQNGVSKDHWQ